LPEDEVGEAFFDRFLVRLSVGPVSDAGFRALLDLEPEGAPPLPDALDEKERQALAAAAGGWACRSRWRKHWPTCAPIWPDAGAYVSDRRWVKSVGLLRTAAASEGRDRVSVWDLGLLSWCVAPEPGRQAEGGRLACPPSRCG
jgi:MoxR-like ATPase